MAFKDDDKVWAQPDPSYNPERVPQATGGHHSRPTPIPDNRDKMPGPYGGPLMGGDAHAPRITPVDPASLRTDRTVQAVDLVDKAFAYLEPNTAVLAHPLTTITRDHGCPNIVESAVLAALAAPVPAELNDPYMPVLRHADPPETWAQTPWEARHYAHTVGTRAAVSSLLDWHLDGCPPSRGICCTYAHPEVRGRLSENVHRLLIPSGRSVVAVYCSDTLRRQMDEAYTDGEGQPLLVWG